MKKFNKKKNNSRLDKYIVTHNSTLLNVMKTITLNQNKACIVLKNKKFLKVVTDGDIRRSLINGFSLKDKIENVHNRTSKYFLDSDPKSKIINSINSRFSIIPILNSKHALVDIVFAKKDQVTNIQNKKISIIGLGYVGLTLSLVLAENDLDVIGYDNNVNTVTKLKRKHSPFFERYLSEYLNKNVNKNFRITSDVHKFIADIYIICVGTPIDAKTKKPKINLLLKAVSDIAFKIKKGDLIILRSTVPTGFTRNKVIPLLQKYSNLQAGQDFKIAFCPERTIEGKALEELSELPQIIGGFDRESTDLSINFFNTYSKTVIDVGSLEAAELSKLIDNSYRDVKFAYSNQIALFCEKLNLDAHDIISKVNLGYERNDIAFPSPGVGGPCLSKDPYILHNNFIDNKINESLILNARKFNEDYPLQIYNRIFKFFQSKRKKFKSLKIFIIGFAFKGEPETSDMRNSTTINFLNILKKNKHKIIFGYDPVVKKEDLKKLNIKVCDLNSGFKNADIVMFMNNHKMYSKLNIIKLTKTMNDNSILYDGWNIYKKEIFNSIKNTKFIGVGK